MWIGLLGVSLCTMGLTADASSIGGDVMAMGMISKATAIGIETQSDVQPHIVEQIFLR